MRIALISVLLSLFLFLPMSVDAQGLVNCSGPDCDFCSAMNMANNIINWLIGILAVVAVLVFVVAGFRLVTSAGNPEAMSFFKARLLYIVIGFTLVLTAWLIVDAMLRGLTEQGGLEFWGRFDVEQCSSQNNPSLSVVEDPDITPLDILIDEVPGWSAGVGTAGSGYTSTVGDAACDTPEACASREDECETQGGVSEYDPDEGVVHCIFASGDGAYTPAAGADGVLDYQSGIRSQISHASPALNSMLNCIANRVPADVGQVSSISDSLIVSGAQSWDSCRAGNCQHAANSCHYGGPNGGSASVAVDFGDEWNVTAICGAARSCGAVADCSVHNGNHVHLSLAGYSCR